MGKGASDGSLVDVDFWDDAVYAPYTLMPLCFEIESILKKDTSMTRFLFVLALSISCLALHPGNVLADNHIDKKVRARRKA